MILEYKIDLIAIQETKKESFTTRLLNSISNTLDIWLWVPSMERSKGILFGGDNNQIKILHH